MRVTTSLSESVGVDAPAVIPIFSEPLFAKAGGISAALSTRIVLLQRLLQASYSFRVLALFLPPMTIMASIRPASSAASFWRICVALQMVQWALRPRIFLRSTSSTASHLSGGKVVWATATALSIPGSCSASSGSATTRTSPWAQPAVPLTSGCSRSPTRMIGVPSRELSSTIRCSRSTKGQVRSSTSFPASCRDSSTSRETPWLRISTRRPPASSGDRIEHSPFASSEATTAGL